MIPRPCPREEAVLAAALDAGSRPADADLLAHLDGCQGCGGVGESQTVSLEPATPECGQADVVSVDADVLQAAFVADGFGDAAEAAAEIEMDGPCVRRVLIPLTQ